MVNPFQFVMLVLSLDSERKGRNLETPPLGDMDDLSRFGGFDQLMKAQNKHFEMFHLKKGNN